MSAISMKNTATLLKLSFWIGATTDGLAIIPMAFPDIGLALFGSDSSKLGPEYRFAMGLGASLMAGWTILLVWGARRPVERRVILIFTLFPVLAGIIASTVYGVINQVIILGRVIPLWIHLGLLSTLFALSYICACRCEVKKADEHP